MRSIGIVCLLALAVSSAVGSPPQAPMPPQAPPLAPYCLCWRDGHCDCGTCPCPGGRKQFTSTHGQKVWFKRVNGEWTPDEPGWVYDAAAQGWRPVRSQLNYSAPPLQIQPPMFTPQFFGGGGGFRGGRSGC